MPLRTAAVAPALSGGLGVVAHLPVVVGVAPLLQELGPLAPRWSTVQPAILIAVGAVAVVARAVGARRRGSAEPTP